MDEENNLGNLLIRMGELFSRLKKGELRPDFDLDVNKLVKRNDDLSREVDYGGNFKPTFPLEEPNPLYDEGDLRDVYRCKTDRIPTWMPENAFSVHKSTPARIIWDDLEFIEGLHRHFWTGAGLNRKKKESIGENGILKYTPINFESPFSGKYLIADIGHAHLIGVAYKLIANGVDCSYVIKHNINERFREALKYWARRYKEAREGLDDVVGYATMIDTHRGIDENNPIVEPIHFPSPDRLRELGVEEIIYLSERKVDKGYFIEDPDNLLDTTQILKNYENAGFSVKCLGIDYRKNRSGENDKIL